MCKLKTQNPPRKEFHVVFCKVQFSALHCLTYILMIFAMYQAFCNLLYLQMIQILFAVLTTQLHYVTLLILN